MKKTLNPYIGVLLKTPVGVLDLDLRLTVFNLFDRKNIVRIYDPILYAETGNPSGAAGNPAAYSSARHLFFSIGMEW